MLDTKDMVRCALFAAVIAALGLLPPIPVGLPVPITAQSMGVMLAGLMLGAYRGLLAALLLLLLVAVGMPLLSGGRGGFGVFLGPTGGFAIGFAAGAFLTGLLATRLPGAGSVVSSFFAAAIGGIVGLYALGIPWLAFVADLPLEKAAMGSVIFLPGDLIKAAIAALVAVTVRRGYPDLVPASK